MTNNTKLALKDAFPHLEDTLMGGGMWDVSDIDYIFMEDAERHFLNSSHIATIQHFLDLHGPSVVAAAPYETYGIYLFARKPESFSWENTDGYVGRGANLLVKNSPRTLLILAEND